MAKEELDCPGSEELFSDVLDMDETGIPNTDEENLVFANRQTEEYFNDGQTYWT
jgi:hypothetical protein